MYWTVKTGRTRENNGLIHLGNLFADQEASDNHTGNRADDRADDQVDDPANDWADDREDASF